MVQGKFLFLSLGLIWLARIGIDGLFGYGLKYEDHFQHTHLGQLGKPGGYLPPGGGGGALASWSFARAAE